MSKKIRCKVEDSIHVMIIHEKVLSFPPHKKENPEKNRKENLHKIESILRQCWPSILHVVHLYLYLVIFIIVSIRIFRHFWAFFITKFAQRVPLIFHLISSIYHILVAIHSQKGKTYKSEKVFFCTIFSLCRARMESSWKIYLKITAYIEAFLN